MTSLTLHYVMITTSSTRAVPLPGAEVSLFVVPGYLETPVGEGQLVMDAPTTATEPVTQPHPQSQEY